MECWEAHASGNPTETAFRRYERLARGNADVHTVEALSVVDENGRQLRELTPVPQNRKRLSDVVAATRKANPIPAILRQLTHSG